MSAPAPAPAAAAAAPAPKVKLCSRCGDTKPETEFSGAQLRQGGKRICPPCVKLKQADLATAEAAIAQARAGAPVDLAAAIRAHAERVELRSTATAGLGCFAIMRFRAGEIVFEEQAEVSVSRIQDEVDELAATAHALIAASVDRPYLDHLSVRAWDAMQPTFSASEVERLLRARRDVGVAQWQRACGQVINNFFSSMGANIYLRTSFINHSCAPNCEATGLGGGLRALRDIAVGEELTYNYADGENNFLSRTKHTRRTYLRKRWGFECHCTECA